MGAASTQARLPLVDGLLQPSAYPHRVVEPIRLAETHISWVFLTGDYAYKVKKPVRLSFLDYSTLARRREFCDEELRLNRRFAPDLYLGVSRIGGSAGQPRVDADGPAIEYAVRMRQFAPDNELAALLDADGVSERDLAALGAVIADFHAAAAGAPAGTAFGAPATVHRVTLDNFDELRTLPEAASWTERISALEARVTTLHASLTAFMTERRATGMVREGHGDLHCGNVVRWQGRLTPFDGIEFDPKLRFVDVVNDIAFLTMDLAERGHAEFRRAVLQAWSETLGDWPGLRLLPYYETYRALVRAKVAALRARQLPADAPHRAEAVQDSLRYLGWAEQRLAPRRPPLVITCGLSGSGKTWLAQRLRGPLSALQVRSDVERKRLAGLRADEDSRSPADAGIYTLEFNARTYARLLDCAAAALAAGEPMIVDAAFLRLGERLSFLELADRAGVPFVIVHCTAPEAVLRQRVLARTAARNDASEAGIEVLARQPGYWEPFDAREMPRVIELDTSDPAVVSRAIARIGSG